ncbi:gremlin-1-like [Culicoides brevitarsis]|uniref:gremlin-1-like n=1 Tax=Culicoides brevitarsis TaxID=469753 RepID=UPI00307BEF7D
MDIISMFLIFLSTVLLPSSSLAHARRVSSDSILDIIDTRNVQRILAERRANESRQSKRFLIQNNMRLEQQQQQNRAPMDDQFDDESTMYAPEVINFDFNDRHAGLPIRGEIVTYNDSMPTYNTGQENADLLNDLQAYRGDKILKSSKNALYITRKEYLKKDWCKTEPLIQRIKEEGCLTRTIINRFCYGQCNSFYIPKGPSRRRRNNARRFKSNGDFEDEDLTGAMFKSCAFCKPKKFAWISVTLRCPSMVPQLRRKRIQRIKQCRCMAEPVD